MADILKHLDLNSADGTQFNIDALYQIAPSAFTEVRDDKTGAISRKVNFEVLRQLLGDHATDGEGEMYQFTWVGKNAARAEAAKPTDKTLRPVPEDSVDWDNTKNIYIEGDNLEVLKLLQRSYMGKVKMIYIDPPYNTGNDFVYHDGFARTAAEEDIEAGNVDELGYRFRKNTDTNGKFHSDWCSMIYSRLLVARSLLTEDGVFFISIDDNEVENLRKVCDELYGEKNFLGCLTIVVKPEGRRYGSFAKCHENCLVYAKDSDIVECNEIEVEGATYQYFDEQGGFNLKGLRNRNVKAFNSTNRPNLRYPFYVDTNNPDKNGLFKVTTIADQNLTKVEASVIDGLKSVWRWGKETSELKKDQLTAFKGPDGTIRIFQKERKLTQTAKTVWLDKNFISNKGTKEVAELLGKGIFDYPKPVSLIKQIIQIGTDENSLVLDFFSGSATTAQAIMQLNSEDEGHRNFICVQYTEETPEDSEARKAGYITIPEIAKERIRRAGAKIKADSPLTTQNLDTGFRVYRLDESNYEKVSISPKEYKQDQLDLFANNIKADRTDLDLLYGSMLAWGVRLDLPLQTETVDGCIIYTVNEGDLVACFSEGITDKVVAAMADKSPLRVLFRDACFREDDQKINIYEQFKQALDWADNDAFNNIRVI